MFSFGRDIKVGHMEKGSAEALVRKTEDLLGWLDEHGCEVTIYPYPSIGSDFLTCWELAIVSSRRGEDVLPLYCKLYEPLTQRGVANLENLQNEMVVSIGH